MIARKLLIIAATVLAGPAMAASPTLDLPAGTLGDAVIALGAQAGASIMVDDAAAWGRRVPRIRGQMTVRRALDRLARASGVAVRPAGSNAWRLVAVPPRARRLRPSLAPASAVTAVDADEIVVTGSKRDVRLGEFPGQVAILDGDDLATGGAGGTDTILSRLASVSSTHLGAGRNKLFIRGIADSSFTGPTQATVGQYLGDIRLSYNAPDPDLRLHDIAAVEVMEGPQGTLYGAGSLGGIIRMVPNVPHFGTSAALALGASATQHGEPGADIGGVVNLPLAGDRIALRVVGYAATDGGYIDNPQRGEDDINRTRTAGGRATLRFDLGDAWTVDLGGVVQSVRGDDSQYADRDTRGLERNSPVEQGFDADYKLGQVIVSGEIGDVRVRSTTGIAGQHLSERYDATMSPSVPMIFRQRNATRLIANETRAWRPATDGFGWVVGLSLTDNRTRLSRALGRDGAIVPVTGVVNRTREATGFGEASVTLRPGLIATAGARVTRVSLSGEGRDVAPAIALLRSELVATRDATSVLPSAALIATVLPQLSLYARYQEGFRPGGLAIEGDFVRRFRQDRVGTLETGVRYGRSGRDAVWGSASISHTRWDDIQADFIDAGGLPSTANIGDGRIWTFGATAGWRPTPGFTIDAGVNYNNSRVTEPSPNLFIALTRMSRVPNVAAIAGRVGIDYRRAVGNGEAELRINGWARYVGRSRLGIGPVLGDPQGDYLDTALNLRIGRPTLGMTIGVTNLTDELGNRFALGTPFQIARDQITPLRPRTIRIGLDTAF